MIPLHPQAADALRELIELAKAAAAAARFDTWAQQPVRWVFMHRGQPMSKHYLFDEPLEIACMAAGLMDHIRHRSPPGVPRLRSGRG
jgi:hypothetical protein